MRGSTVRERLDLLEDQIKLLQNDQERLIANEPLTLKHLPVGMTGMYGKERYVVVYADGSLPRYVHPLTQRPAALKVARKPGRYIWDTRENVVLDGEGNVVHSR